MSSTEETVTLRRSARKSVIAKSQDEAPSTPRKTRGTTPLKTSVEATASPGGVRKQRGTTPTKKSLVAVEKVSTPKRNLPTVKEETPRKKKLSSMKEDRNTPKKKSPPPKKSLSSVKEDKSTPKKNSPPSKKSVSSLKEDEGTPRKRRAAASPKKTSVEDQKKNVGSPFPKKADKEKEDGPKIEGVSLEGGRLARGKRKSMAITVPMKETTDVASSRGKSPRSQSDSSPETVHPRGRARKSVRFVGAPLQTSSSGGETAVEENSQTEDSGKKEMKKSDIPNGKSSVDKEFPGKSCHVCLERLSIESLEELGRESNDDSYLATFPKSNENPPRHEIIEAVKAEVIEENVSETALVPSDGQLENARQWPQGTRSDKANDTEVTSQRRNDHEAIPGEGKEEATTVFDNCLLSPKDFLNSEDDGTDEISEDREENSETIQKDDVCPSTNHTKSPRRKLSFTKPVSESSSLQKSLYLTSKIEGNEVEQIKSREGKEHEFLSSSEDESPGDDNGKKSGIVDNQSEENRMEASHNVPSSVTVTIGSCSESNTCEKISETEESKGRNILKEKDIPCEETAKVDGDPNISNPPSTENLPVENFVIVEDSEDLQLKKISNDKQENQVESKSVENTLLSQLTYKETIGSKYFKQFESSLIEKCEDQIVASPETGRKRSGEIGCNVIEGSETNVESPNEKSVLENEEKQEHLQKYPGGKKEKIKEGTESIAKVCEKEKELSTTLKEEHLEDICIENSPEKIKGNSSFNENPEIICEEPQKTTSSVGDAKEITVKNDIIANSPEKRVKDGIYIESVVEICIIKSPNKQRNETNSNETLFEKIETVKSPMPQMSSQAETEGDNTEMLIETPKKHGNDSISTGGIDGERHNSFISVESAKKSKKRTSKNSESDIEKPSVVKSTKEYVANKSIEGDEEDISAVESPPKRKKETISYETICEKHQTNKSPLKKQVSTVEVPKDTSVKSPKKYRQESLSEIIAEEQISIDENTENNLDGTFIIESPEKHKKESVSNEGISEELVNKTSEEQATSVEESEGDVEEVSFEKSPKKLRKKSISEEVENTKSPKKQTPSTGVSEGDVQEICSVHSPKKNRKKSVSFFVDVTEELETVNCTPEQQVLSSENIEGDIEDSFSVETPTTDRKKSVCNEKITEELTTTKSPKKQSLKIQEKLDDVGKSPKKRRLENFSEIIAEDQVSTDENTENDLEGNFLIESPEKRRKKSVLEERTESAKQKTIFIEDSDVEEIRIGKSPKIHRKKSVSNEAITEKLVTTISPKINIKSTEKSEVDIEGCILKSPEKHRKNSISVEEITEEFQTKHCPMQQTVAIEDSDGEVEIIFIEKSPKKPRRKSISTERITEDPETKTFPKQLAISIEDSEEDVEVISFVNSAKKHRKKRISNDEITEELVTAKPTKEQQILSPEEVIEEPCVAISPKKLKKMSISDEGIREELEAKNSSKNFSPSDEISVGNVEEICIQKSKKLGKRSFSNEGIVEVLATPKSPKKLTFSTEVSAGDVEEICIENSPKKHRKRNISNEGITEELVTTMSPKIQITSAEESEVDTEEDCIVKSPKKHRKKSMSDEGSTEEVGTKSSDEQISSPERAKGVLEGISVRESSKKDRKEDVSNEGITEEFATSESPNEQISSIEEADDDNEETSDGKSPRKRRKDSSTEESSTETSNKFHSIRKYFLDLEAKEKGVMVDDSESLETTSSKSGSDSSESSAQSARDFLDIEAVEDNEYDPSSDSLSVSTSDESVDELVKKRTEDAFVNTANDGKKFVSRAVIFPGRSDEKEKTEGVKLYSQFLKNLRRSSEYKLKNKFKVSKCSKAELEKEVLKSKKISIQTNAGKFTVRSLKETPTIDSRDQLATNVHSCFTVTSDKNLLAAKQSKSNKQINIKNIKAKQTSKKHSENLLKTSEQSKTEGPPVKKGSTSGQTEAKGPFVGTVLLDYSIEVSSLREALKYAGVTGVKHITLVNNDTTAFIEFSSQKALQEALYKSANLKLKLNKSFFFILLPGNNQ